MLHHWYGGDAGPFMDDGGLPKVVVSERVQDRWEWSILCSCSRNSCIVQSPNP